jgi:DNA-binding response OmpR family regulator
MSLYNILVADGSPTVSRAIATVLEASGFDVVETETGAEVVARAANGNVAAIILDLDRPDARGFEVLRDLRRTSFLPIMVVSTLTNVEDRVLAFEMGADDFLLKPFAPRELLARMRALLRRSQPQPTISDHVHAENGLRIDAGARQVTLEGRPVELTTKEFDLLAFLARSPRHVFTRDELLREVWGSRIDWQDPATVTEHIRRVRRKIEADPSRPQFITTVRSVGYRFESAALAASAA